MSQAKNDDDGRDRTRRILNVRTSPALREDLEQIADRNGDTLAATIRQLLRDSIERRQRGEQ